MDEADDWQLMGQERYLAGVTLHWSMWHQSRPNWDHDHCEFCLAKFMEESEPDALHAGYTTADEYRWVCPTCFADFRERFGWHVAGVAKGA
jgi:hypothetical protein